MTLSSSPSSAGARCPAAGSIRQALNRAITLVEMEFPSLEGKGHRQNTIKGGNCSTLKAEWKCRKALLLVHRTESVRRTLVQVLKSCDRFFDVPCAPCDKKAFRQALGEWQLRVSTPPPGDPAAPASWSEQPLSELARRVRLLVGTKWGKGMEEARRACLVPDQAGCFELPRGSGGTLSVHPREYHSGYDLRVGTAKSKGKVRVVTMQPARVKEILRPVHDCLYDFLSRRRWIVRGEVSKEHMQIVVDDLRDGEMFVSGDYEGATDNIYTEASFEMAKVLAECPYLTDVERTTLLESFRPENLHWTSRKNRCHPIRRGQMMGNLVSFPLLCLINKACFDIACSLRRKRTGVKSYRRPIINGDDIAFCGDAAFVSDWEMVTSSFGLKVNREKTGVSSEYIELNSRSYRVGHGFLRKPVLSALLPGDDPSCLLTRLWNGLRTLSPGSLRWAVIMLRHDIQKRGVDLSSVPSRLRRVLLRERWFRMALSSQPCVKVVGVERAWPVVSRDFRPPASHLPLYEAAKRKLLKIGVALVRGREVKHAFSRRLNKCYHPPRHLPGVYTFRARWVFRWYQPLWDWWDKNGLPLESLPLGRWADDHPDLASKVEVDRLCPGYGPSADLLFDAVRPNGVNWV
nr:MAG: RNA-dependent RNA polymerase [Botourmiaviridae sp.]